MDESIKLLNPESRLGVIKRYLHVLALLQNNKDPEDWTSTKLADELQYDERDADVSGKAVRDYIRKDLLEYLGVDINITQGGRKIELDECILKIYGCFLDQDFKTSD